MGRFYAAFCQQVFHCHAERFGGSVTGPTARHDGISKQQKNGDTVNMNSLFKLSKHRMDPLIDGVFAVALTILALEIKVPELEHPGSSSELIHALLHHGSVIGAYFFSFALLGMFWIWHHRLSDKVSEIDGALLGCSLAFLSLICLFPFASAVFGRYMFSGNVAALLVYLPLLGLILVSQTLYFALAMRRGLIRADFPITDVYKAHRNNLYSLAFFLLSCIPAAQLLGTAASLACVVLALLLIWAGRRSTPPVTPPVAAGITS
jgi:uncharacterized membrane protein